MSNRTRTRSRTIARRPRRGFSLIELLLVMVILAILAGIVVPKFVNRTGQAKEARARTDIANIETALDAYEVDTGRFPSSDEALGALDESGVDGWKGPYIKRGIPRDPWGNPYVYRFPGAHNRGGYDLSSHGPDGREGGGDDITNWSQQ